MPEVQTNAERSGWRRWWPLLAILALGLALRLFRLDYQSVWYDEAFSLTVGRMSLVEMMDKFLEDFVHPPVHYYLLHGWFNVVGYGAYQARLLSAIFGTMALVIMYLLGEYLFDRRTAILATLLLAVSQLSVMYSQEARAYSKVQFFSLTAVYLFIRATRDRSTWAWFGFVIAATLMSLSHYFSVMVLFVLGLYILLYRKQLEIRRSWWLGAALIMMAAWIPWLASGVVGQAWHGEKTLRPAQPDWFSITSTTILSSLNRFNNGAVPGFFVQPSWLVVVSGFVLLTIPAVLALRPLLRPDRTGNVSAHPTRELALLAGLWLVPFLLVQALGIIKFQYDVRYIFFAAAPYYMLAARGLLNVRMPAVSAVAITLALVMSGIGLRSNYFVPYKENYRDAFAHMVAECQPGDACVFLPYGKLPIHWSVYYSGPPDIPVADLDDVLSGRTGSKRLWVIEYRRVADLVRRIEEMKHDLGRHYRKLDEENYFWIRIALYEPVQPSTRSTALTPSADSLR